jgi:hypothetical protein
MNQLAPLPSLSLPVPALIVAADERAGTSLAIVLYVFGF